VDVYATDEEKVEQLKKWWRENGRSLVIGVVIGLAIVFGWRYWSHYRAAQAEGASNAYAQLMGVLVQGNKQAVLAEGEQIINQYSGSPYAVLSALALARVRVEQGELAAAHSELQWAVDHASMPALQHIARLRLGRVMLAQGKADAALALVAGVKDQGAFASRYQELLGDIYVQQGKPEQARVAYQKAVDSLAPGSRGRALMTMKLDNLAGVGSQDKKQ
jgi:predicted negative regulator of RcsB-dependent stress response